MGCSIPSISVIFVLNVLPISGLSSFLHLFQGVMRFTPPNITNDTPRLGAGPEAWKE
jgi:hypothetical protein